jgi:hypothetical protein
MPDDPNDPIEDLRERIRATQRAAERIADAAAGARANWENGDEPPSGWATSREHAQRNEEVQALAALLQTLRDLVPAELQEQFRDVMRQLLLLLRGLVDWWIDRLERDGPAPAAGAGEPDIEDIPID